MTTDRFLLDSDYANFTSSEQLKFSTMNPRGKENSTWVWWCIFLFIPITIIFAGFTVQKFMASQTYATDGQTIDATIIQCEMIDHGRVGYEPKLTFSYSVNGVTYQASDTMRTTLHDDCDDYPSGLNLPARYLLSDPQQSELVGAETAISVGVEILGYVLASLIAGGVSIFLFYMIVKSQPEIWRDKARYRRLRSSGVLLDGDIVSTSGKISRQDNAYHFSVIYRFQTPNGQTRARTQTFIRDDLRDLGNRPLAGTPVSVLYADDDAVVML